MIYNNSCGKLTLNVADPHPAWVTIKEGENEIYGLVAEDLRDLRHLIDRALSAIESRRLE